MLKASLLLFIAAIIEVVFNKEVGQIEIQGIEPNSGPVYGETRVVVRIRDFDRDLIDDYDRPKVSYYLTLFS